MPEDQIAKEVCREIEQEKTDRGNFDELYTQIARRILPVHDTFQGRNMYGGERRTEWQFDSLGARNLTRFAAVYGGMATPPNEQWHGLEASDDKVAKSANVKRWCEYETEGLFKDRYNHKAGFSQAVHESYLGLGAFGTAVMFIEDKPGQHYTYIGCPLSKTWIREGQGKRVDTVYRELEYRPHRAIQEFGKDNLPQRVLQAAENNPNQKFKFFHRVMPNAMVDRSKRFDPSGMGFHSIYISEEGKQIVGQGGFRTFPFAVTRYITDSNEKYGRSVAMDALPDIKMRNEMRRSILRSTHRMAEPPMLVSDDASLAVFQMRPGFKNKGYISDNGVELAKQLEWRGDLAPALKVLEETQQVVDDIFFVTVFQILLENPTMTATQVLEILKERGILLTPTVGRFQAEFLGAIVERELDIRAARGLLSPMPEELIQIGGLVDISYKGPLARAQQAEQALGFTRTLESVAPFAQVKPDILDRFNLDTALPELAEIHGMPIAWLYTQDEYAALKQQQDQQQAAMAAAGAAPGLAAAAKDAAQARLFSQQAGGV